MTTTLNTTESKGLQNHFAQKVDGSLRELCGKVYKPSNDLLLLGRDSQHPNPIIKLVHRVFEQAVTVPVTAQIEDVYDKDKADFAALTVKERFYPSQIRNKKGNIKNTLRKIVGEWRTKNIGLINANFFLARRLELINDIVEYLENFDAVPDKIEIMPLFDRIRKYNEDIARQS